MMLRTTKQTDRAAFYPIFTVENPAHLSIWPVAVFRAAAQEKAGYSSPGLFRVPEW